MSCLQLWTGEGGDTQASFGGSLFGQCATLQASVAAFLHAPRLWVVAAVCWLHVHVCTRCVRVA